MGVGRFGRRAIIVLGSCSEGALCISPAASPLEFLFDFLHSKLIFIDFKDSLNKIKGSRHRRNQVARCERVIGFPLSDL